MLAAVGDAKHFRSGRRLASNLGVTPTEHSSGGQQRLGRISKCGNAYLRRLLIHGARTVLRHAPGKTDPLSQWVLSVKARRGMNVATVALANKLARRRTGGARQGALLRRPLAGGLRLPRHGTETRQLTPGCTGTEADGKPVTPVSGYSVDA